MDINYYKKYEPIFGSWRIVRQLGAGSFGTVFEIEREDFGHTYRAALKAITIPQSSAEVDETLFEGHDRRSAAAYYQNFVSELINEVSIMSEFKGESNIVSYEDHCVIPHADGLGWDILIRMELLTPLLKYASSHSLGRSEIIKLGTHMCRALELCGKRNIIHRDIKPENIFVSESGNFKLGDFGIARTVERDGSGLSKKGTYTYMAPEVYRGEEYGASVDIYSLGIVLYRFLNNNRAPFMPPYPTPISYGDREQTMARRINGEPIPAPVNADPALAQVILKACAYDPRERYASAAEMRRALEAVVSAGGDNTEIPDNHETTLLEYSSGGSARGGSSQRGFAQFENSQSRFNYSPQPDYGGGQAGYARFDSQTGQPLYQSGSYPGSTGARPQARFTEQKPGRSKLPAVIAVCVALALIVGGIVWRSNRTGWNNAHDEYYSNGKPVTGWQEIDGDMYYFGEDNTVTTGRWKIGYDYYYFDDDGKMATGKVTFEENESEVYYFAEDGTFLYKEVTYSGDNVPDYQSSAESADFYISDTDIWSCRYYEITDAAINCVGLTIKTYVLDGGYNSEWVAFIQTDNGWEKAGYFDVNNAGEGTFEITFDLPINLYAFTTVPNSVDGADSLTYSKELSEIVLCSFDFGSVDGEN